MNRSESKQWKKFLGTVALRAGGAALLCLAMGVRNAEAYPMYDDDPSSTIGVGCVTCHNGFIGGPSGILHFQHVNKFGITQASCNFCHPSGAGSKPVKTYTSGIGGGYGCAGCHGLLEYGETSPNSGQPKASGYGLRAFHALKGVTVCSTCHFPGSTQTGAQNPAPTILPENVKPPYYLMPGTSLRNPCDSHQEDISSGEQTPDSVGLDNDGNGFADYPADPACPTTTTTTTSTTTTTTTLPVECGPAPVGVCIAPAKATLNVNEKSAGKEKLKVSLTKLVPMVSQNQFGDPVGGTTSYAVCIYNASDALVGSISVARGGESCGSPPEPCWAAVKTTGYKYGDKTTSADGIAKISLAGGDAGKGKVTVLGKNNSSDGQTSLPTGIAALLLNNAQATVQFLTSDGGCFGVKVTDVKTADGSVFSAAGP